MNRVSERLRELADDLQRIGAGRHHDPHQVLGRHDVDGQSMALAYLPGARLARLERRHEMRRIRGTDVFAWVGVGADLPAHCRLSWIDEAGALREQIDPYGFAPAIAPSDLAEFAAGTHASAWSFLGAHAMSIDGVAGVRFAVWAPNAERVSVVGPFCQWDGRRCPMRVLGGSGIWELFLPGLGAGEIYKFELRARAGGAVFLKSDPYARATELRPATA